VQGGVDVWPGSGGEQGGAFISPAKAERLSTNAKMEDAPILLKFFIVFSLAALLVFRFMFENEQRKAFQSGLRSVSRVTPPVLPTQSLYRVYRKALLT
jgi:hypothetical protein